MDNVESGQQTSGRYSLKNRLSHGGMGEVWLATDTLSQNQVVVKFLSPSLNDNPAAVELLHKEFQHSRLLIHPNIVRGLALEELDDRLCLVTEYAGAKTLENFKPADYRELLPLLFPILDALSYAHDSGIVHRDIKPTNIIVDDENVARLTDFGLSLSLDAETDLSGGSMFYMSPQRFDGSPIDVRDDIYSFGATLYELINGHPPFYPNVTPERVASEVPGPLKSKVVLPSKLDALVFAMLSKRRDERPASFMEVREALLEFTDLPDNQTLPPEHVSVMAPETIQAVSFDQPTANTPQTFSAPVGEAVAGPAPTATKGFKNEPTVSMRWGVVALGVAIVAVGLVVFLLPKFAPTVTPNLSTQTETETEDFGEIEATQVPPEATAAAATETENTTEPVRAPYEEARFQRERSEAQDFTLALLRQQMALEDKKVTVWAPEEYQKAQQLGDLGDALFREERFAEAMDTYQESEDILETLAERASGVLEELLDAGQSAIDNNDQEMAQEAFESVLQIDPANARAIQGLQVAQAIPTIITLLESGDAKLRAGQLRDARADFDEVLKLYPGSQVASDARREINQRLANIRFDAIMSEGFAAIEANNMEAARDAFERAQKMRPNAQGPKDGLAQVDVSLKGGSIEQLRAEARRLERLEQWGDAAKQYQAALDVDDSLIFAKQGKFRTMARSRLNDQLESYIRDAQKLSEEPVFNKAQDVLAQAEKLNSQGPRLKAQIKTVRGLLDIARIPVRVRLTSDNITNVVMYKVGRFGTFDNHELDLIPGTYTLVGSRPGYRDVRLSLVVRPGVEPAPFPVRCEDKI